MDFQERMQLYRDQAETHLSGMFTIPELSEKKLYEAMCYSVANGGKRIRPVLSLAVAELLEVSREWVLPYACALEMIHTYSLIHDDLPAMDNDDLRRGMPTNHIVYGEALAILAGDALLNGAYEYLLTQATMAAVPARALAVAVLIANAAGKKGMIAGQVIDMESTSQPLTLVALRRLHQLKTGALIRAAILLPAVLNDSPPPVVDALENFAEAIGVAFQIKDDLLDVESTTAVLGKPVGSDEKNKKATYVQLLGIDGARHELQRAIGLAQDALSLFGEKADFLSHLAGYIGKRSY